MNKPFELQFLECLSERYELPQSLEWRLENYRTGFIGEGEFLLMLLPEIPKDWEVLADLNFPLAAGRMQIDVMLISPHKICHFEVKKLLQNYVYENGTWMCNGREIGNDFFIQMKRARGKLVENLQKIGVNVTVESKLILINEEDTVSIMDADQQNNYIKRWHVKGYLREIIQDTSPALINPSKVAKEILKMTAPSHEGLNVRGSELVPYVRGGILCDSCGGGKIKYRQRYHIQCKQCGSTESKERAILRTICDYGVLHYTKNLVLREVKAFINERSLDDTIRKVLRKHFDSVGYTKVREYVNPVSKMENVYKEVKFRYQK